MTTSRFVDSSLSPSAISRMIARGVASEVTRAIRCGVHNQAPNVAIVRAAPDGLEYSITGCCDHLRKKARTAIDELLGGGATGARHRANAA